MEMTPETIRALTGGTWLREPDAASVHQAIKQISIDTRTISPGDFFWAIKGERFDGHDFVNEAIIKGAAGVVVSRSVPLKDSDCHNCSIVCVEDTLESLQKAAMMWREQFNCPVVAITGSSGKTTTRELITHILSQKLFCLSTEKNMNNHIGVPLTLLRLRDCHQVCVLELGMNHRGEIALLTGIVKPTIGIITNIGRAHIGFLDSLNGIVEAKAELLEDMDSDGIAILNQDSPFYHLLASKCHNGIVSVGFSEGADFRIQKVELLPVEGKTSVTYSIKGESFSVKVPLLGRFVAYNLLMAVATALKIGFKHNEIESGIAQFIPLQGRMYHYCINDIHILDDSYNANPDSVHSALKTLIECKGTGKSLAILGDMLELGNQSECLHRQLGQWLGYGKKVDYIITYGHLAQIMAQEAIKTGYPQKMIWSTDNYEEITHLAKSILHPNDWVLIKGSRGMGLDTVSKMLIEFITNNNVNKEMQVEGKAI